MRPLIARISVLLPQPDGPATSRTSPGSIGRRDVADRRLRRPPVAEGEPVDLDERRRVGHRRRRRQAGRMRTGRSRASPSRLAASPWLSASARWPSESAVQQGCPERDVAEGPRPDRPLLDGRRAVVGRELEDHGAAGGQRSDRRLEIGRHAGERDVAEDQDVDDRPTRATPSRIVGSDRRQADEPFDRDRRPDGFERHARPRGGRPSGRRCRARGSCSRSSVEHQLAVLQRARLDDPAERLAAAISSPLSGPIRMSPRAVRSPTARRLVPTPGSTTATWIPTGMYGRANTSVPRAFADRVARHLVRDVDDVGVRAEPEHHRPADGRRGRSEVGRERDDGAHPRMVPGRGRAARRAEAAPGGGSAPLRRSV